MMSHIHKSPPLMPVAVVHVALFLSGVVVPTVLAGGAHFPSPFDPRAEAAGWFAAHPTAVAASALLQFAAAMPLLILSAAVASRLRFLGGEVAGVGIALVGGVGAGVLLAASASVQWVLSQGVDDIRPLHLLAFAFGGPGTIVPLGLLVAGVAVTAGLERFLPGWMMWSGLVIAAIAEFSTLSLFFPAAAVLLPIARFPAFIWLVLAAWRLPRARGRTASSNEVLA